MASSSLTASTIARFLSAKVGVHRADTGIVQSGGDGIRFLNLSVFVLDHKRTCPMNDPHFSELDGGCRHPGFNSLAAGFGQYDPYPFVVDVMIDGSGSIASSAHAGNQIVRIVTSFFLLEAVFLSLR